jgi:aspartyl-tRNA(Asn)/glutamyl-tRNA(Gln) amidotransferase subunit C
MYAQENHARIGCVKGGVHLQITTDLVRKIAKLAKLQLSDAEVKAYTPQLERILSKVERLDEVDTKEVAPLYHPLDMICPLRADSAEASGFDWVTLSPESSQHQYRVPPVLS